MNDQTRREFLINCYRIGGFAAIASLGMGAVEDARGWGILPAVVSGGGSVNTSWADWDETTEEGWKGSLPNTFICLFENTVAGGDETGQGSSVSGADLVLSQAGSVPSATGSPPTRALDTNYWFTFTDTLAQIMCSSTWTIIEKWNTVDDGEGCFFRIVEGVNDGILQLTGNNGIMSAAWDAGSCAATATGAPKTGDTWYAIQADGVHNVTLAWDTSKITDFGKIAAAQKSVGDDVGDFSGETAGGGGVQCFATALAQNHPALQVTGKAYYLIITDQVLINY